MTGMRAASHTLFVVLYSHDAYKKGENEVISFHILVHNALRWLKNPHISTLLPPEDFKASCSAGFSLCTETVQSITLSLIIHVTTS